MSMVVLHDVMEHDEKTVYHWQHSDVGGEESHVGHSLVRGPESCGKH